MTTWLKKSVCVLLCALLGTVLAQEQTPHVLTPTVPHVAPHTGSASQVAPPVAHVSVVDSVKNDRYSKIRSRADSIRLLPVLGPNSAWDLMALVYSAEGYPGSLWEDHSFYGIEGGVGNYFSIVWRVGTHMDWDDKVVWQTSVGTPDALDYFGGSLVSFGKSISGRTGTSMTWRQLAYGLSLIGTSVDHQDSIRDGSTVSVGDWYRVDSAKIRVVANELDYLEALTHTRSLRGSSKWYGVLERMYLLSRLDRINGVSGGYNAMLIMLFTLPFVFVLTVVCLRFLQQSGRKHKDVWLGASVVFGILTVLGSLTLFFALMSF